MYSQKLNCHKSFQVDILSGTSVTPTSEVCLTAVMVLEILGN